MSSDAAVLPQTPAVPARIRWIPGLVLALVLLGVVAYTSQLVPETFGQFITIMLGPGIASLLVAAWWLFASRAAWVDRFLGLALLVGGGAASLPFLHPSMKIGFLIWAIPTAVLMLVVGTFGGRVPLARTQRVILSLLVLAGWFYFTLLRVDGTTGSLASSRAWRWEPTAEDKFLAARQTAPSKSPDAVPETSAPEASTEPPLALAEGDWPEFRGPQRNSIVASAAFGTNWEQTPPKALWKHAIGPGWSSFAVIGDRLFTQEQRGDDEAIVCYDAGTGAEVWVHADKSRFWETIAGAGPRGTPTFANGRLYALGANGLLNCLDARTGQSFWQVDVVKLTDSNIPEWGLSASPLVVGDRVFIHTGKPKDRGLVALDAATGKELWSIASGAHSYSSAQLVTLLDVPQLLIVTDFGIQSVHPEDGKALWTADWVLPTGMNRVVQPAIIGNSSVILGTGYGEGSRRYDLSRAEDGTWKVKQAWATKDLKPYYNDFVVQGEYIYGFDHNILVCIDLATGKKKWKQGRYGFGQMLLVADRNLLILLGEQGELALVEASPKAYREVTRIQALEGKTWNHPVLARGRLYVRNAEEAACFELPPAAEVAQR